VRASLCKVVKVHGTWASTSTTHRTPPPRTNCALSPKTRSSLASRTAGTQYPNSNQPNSLSRPRPTLENPIFDPKASYAFSPDLLYRHSPANDPAPTGKYSTPRGSDPRLGTPPLRVWSTHVAIPHSRVQTRRSSSRSLNCSITGVCQATTDELATRGSRIEERARRPVRDMDTHPTTTA
jgi:hypothetical protein